MRKNRKLVLYSGGQTKANHRLHRELIDLVPMKSHVSMTYIPYCYDGHDVFYKRFIKRYRHFGVSQFHCLPVDRPIERISLKLALESDIIYLAGGNTFYFLKNLKDSGMLRHLKSFVKRGGVLAGLSAGAIILTPEITLAGYPHFECDENDVNLENFKSLDLVDLEFFPHFDFSKRLTNALMRYSKNSLYPIFAAEDGAGLVINGSKKTFIGKSCFFLNGQKIEI